ncbi:hypothetical protein FHR71_002234 [Methylobacterium sp. RAS18]|nr:hypothetical protein [Methylobacterium sp. RAS18]
MAFDAALTRALLGSGRLRPEPGRTERSAFA